MRCLETWCLLVGTFVPGGAVQSARSQGPQQGWHAGEHGERRPWRSRPGDAASAAAAPLLRRRPRRGISAAARSPAPHPPQQGHQQAVRHHALRHRQVFADRVPRVLRVLQPHVLDYLPAHFGRGRR